MPGNPPQSHTGAISSLLKRMFRCVVTSGGEIHRWCDPTGKPACLPFHSRLHGFCCRWGIAATTHAYVKRGKPSGKPEKPEARLGKTRGNRRERRGNYGTLPRIAWKMGSGCYKNAVVHKGQLIQNGWKTHATSSASQ